MLLFWNLGFPMLFKNERRILQDLMQEFKENIENTKQEFLKQVRPNK